MASMTACTFGTGEGDCYSLSVELVAEPSGNHILEDTTLASPVLRTFRYGYPRPAL
jgi:hypothetical protein